MKYHFKRNATYVSNLMLTKVVKIAPTEQSNLFLLKNLFPIKKNAIPYTKVSHGDSWG